MHLLEAVRNQQSDECNRRHEILRYLNGKPSWVVQGERSVAMNIWGRMRSGMAPKKRLDGLQWIHINEYLMKGCWIEG